MGLYFSINSIWGYILVLTLILLDMDFVAVYLAFTNSVNQIFEATAVFLFILWIYPITMINCVKIK